MKSKYKVGQKVMLRTDNYHALRPKGTEFTIRGIAMTSVGPRYYGGAPELPYHEVGIYESELIDPELEESKLWKVLA